MKTKVKASQLVPGDIIGIGSMRIEVVSCELNEKDRRYVDLTIRYPQDATWEGHTTTDTVHKIAQYDIVNR